jgi:hypothetical protein
MTANHSIPEEKPRRTLVIIVAVIAAVLIGGVFYLLMRQTAAPVAPTALADAIRAGSPEFEQYRQKIVLETSDEADQSTNVLGGFQMTLETTVRNFTGRTITGLELRGAVLTSEGKVLRERTMVVVPSAKRSEIEPNKTMFVTVPISGMKESDDRATLWMEVTAFKLR